MWLPSFDEWAWAWQVKKFQASKAKVETEIPTDIYMGMFFVSADIVREKLMKKCDQLEHCLLQVQPSPLPSQFSRIIK